MYVMVVDLVFWEIPDSGSGGVSNSFACSRDPVPLSELPHLALM